MGACGACRTTNTNGLVLREGGSGPRDVIAFMLGRARPEIEDSSAKERADDGLLEWSDDAGVDRSVHEAIFDGIEAVSEDIVIARYTHVTRDGGGCLIC